MEHGLRGPNGLSAAVEHGLRGPDGLSAAVEHGLRGPNGLSAAVERPPAHGSLVSPRPPFPRAVQERLLDHRARLLAAVDDEVLDLSRPWARTAVLAAASGQVPTERYRAVVSVAELLRFPDLLLAFTGIERLLADDGCLLMVEPVHHPGVAATFFATMWTVHPVLARVHVERDVGSAARAAGLELTDLERFTMPTSVWPLRPFVRARARRSTEAVSS